MLNPEAAVVCESTTGGDKAGTVVDDAASGARGASSQRPVAASAPAGAEANSSLPTGQQATPLDAVERLKDLNAKYSELCHTETMLQDWLERLEQEEASLVDACTVLEEQQHAHQTGNQGGTSLQQQERKAREKRLEEALMNSSSDDDDEEEEEE